MKYTSINIQGNLISEEILHKIEEAYAQGQLAKDFGFEPGINLRSEIEYAWSRIKLDWKHFSERIEKLPPSDPYGTTLARKWMMGFFSTLGFELSLQKASLLGDNEQQYTISHTCEHIDSLPIHIVGFFDPSHPQKNTLDIRSSGGTSRLSPHATIQEYLNVTEHLYAMVTNGMLLRLVRDSGHLVKLTYIEFDLKRLLDEDKYSEFTLLYRLLHVSRFPKSKQETEESLLEKYYQDSIESGNRIRNGLSDAVKLSLISLGNGLLEHPENDELREKINTGRPDSREFYHQLLRLIYRLLFLMVTEERDLIFSEIRYDNQEMDFDDLLNGIKRPTKKQKDVYYQYYSLIRLRKLSEKRYLHEDQYTDLWQGLMNTFALFESGGTGHKLGILSLGSELFSGNAMPDISSSKVSNKVLLECIRSLNEFEDGRHNLSFINYRALDVEELGSVYEGLLELEPVFTMEYGKPTFTFKKGSERSSSGSHYTPEDLVKPLIRHSLEYQIEERVEDYYKEKATQEDTKKKLLDLKICDVACGSGHILLSAARRIALEVARVETGEQQPNPASFRHSLKEVIKNCIYGVDKNPLAVELCKVALWLESHNPGEPLSFLDHRIKCGDAIVGLVHRNELQNGIADESFKNLPEDEKEVASTFLKKNRQERTIRNKSDRAIQLTTETDHKLMEEVRDLNRLIENFSELPENTPEEIKNKEKTYNILINSDALKHLKIMADLQIMPFFLKKTETNKNLLLTDSQYFRYLRGESRIPDVMEMKTIENAVNYRFFHWFLEFPEVFQKGGFDCILGNPPFLGGQKLSGSFGNNYLECIKHLYDPIGAVDLVTYFFRRGFILLKSKGFQSLISTNTIAQGKSREGGLDIICSKQGVINHAIRSMRWPGHAAVEVSLVTIHKGDWEKDIILDNKKVDRITPYLDDSEVMGNPFPLKINAGKSFQGSIVLGKGFIITPEQAANLIARDQRNKEVLFPYLNGDDLNNNPEQKPSRWVINFFDWSENRAKTYPDCYKIVEQGVKPERLKKNDKGGKEKWWQFLRPRNELYETISKLDQVMVISEVTKYVSFMFVPIDIVFMHTIKVIAWSDWSSMALLNSSIYCEWAWKYSSTMGSGTLRYTPSSCFDTFPFPNRLPKEQKVLLDGVGEQFYICREKLLKELQLGLTKIYNLFHCRDIIPIQEKDFLLEETSFLKKYSKEVLQLKKHFQNISHTDYNSFIEQMEKFRSLAEKINEIFLDVYGWKDIQLVHGFYELEYLPENDRIRYTIHPEARKEILKRLLKLNHQIYNTEIKLDSHFEKMNEKRDNSLPSLF